MFSNILLVLVVFWIATLPIYLWGYGISYLSGTPWNRRRFLLGMMIGGLSVGLVWVFAYMGTHSLYTLLALAIFVSALGLILALLIRSGSVYARPLLQKFATVNISIIGVLLAIVLLTTSLIPGGLIIALAIAPLLISSLIEESSKHLMSIGLMSQDFAFSRRDIIIFTLFVVLGFVFVENLLYLFAADMSLSTWIFRSSISLMAHLLSAVICAYAWWRALSYEPDSVRYIAIFALGLSLAVLTHLGYNLILREGSILGLAVYMIVGYVGVTRSLLYQKTKL